MSRPELSNYVQDDGTVISVNWSAATVSGGTGSANTAFVTNSTQSLKLVPTGATAQVTKALGAAAFTPGIGSVIGFWVYLKNGDPNTVPTGVPYVSLLMAHSFNAYYSDGMMLSFAGYALKWNQWNYISFNTADTGQWTVTGAGTLTYYGAASFSRPITHIEFDFGGMNGKGIEVYLDSVVINQRSRPKVIFGFDAISTNLTNSVLPMLAAKGITGYATFNGGGGSPTSISQAQAWRDAGWEIINHGYTHLALGGLTTDAAVVAEVETNWDMMVANGLVVAGQQKIWIGPENSYSPRSSRVLRELGYVAGRNYKNIVTKPTKFGVDDLLNMGSISYGNPVSLSKVTGETFAAIALGGTLWGFTHEVNLGAGTGPTGNGNTTFLADLDAISTSLAKWRDAGLVDLPKPSEWYKGLTAPRLSA